MSEREKVDFYFTPERRKEDSLVSHVSESGKYRLETCRYSTSEDERKTWDYSEGKVFRGDELLATVHRNYGRFPFLFVENHPSGQDFLICGEDYQGLTVVNLSTGERRDSLNRDADKGWGFCSSDFTFNEENQVLLVCGCFWGGPYEYRVLDFSNPTQGWETVESERSFEEDPRKPVFQGDTITFFSTPYPTEAQEDAWEKEHGEESDFDRTTLPLAAFWKVRIEGKKLVLVETYMTNEERARRKRDEEDELWQRNEHANHKIRKQSNKVSYTRASLPRLSRSSGVSSPNGWRRTI